MRTIVLLCASLAAAPAFAGIDEVLDGHVLPGYDRFAADTRKLADAARNCDAGAVDAAWNEAFDAWMGVSHLNFGPAEKDGRALAIAFWPDTRGATPKALAALVSDRDPIIGTPEGTAQISAAARGLFALEYLLHDPAYEMADYTCALVAALTADLARTASEIDAEWRDGYADVLRSAGDDGNAVFLSEREARQALFTALSTGLEFTADQRLGRPMGTFKRPRPARAEAWRSGRSLRDVTLSLEALREMADTLADGRLPATDAAFDRALSLAAKLDDPVFAGVETPQGRLHVEALQQAVYAARVAAITEIGAELGVSAGFNAADGDGD